MASEQKRVMRKEVEWRSKEGVLGN